MRRVMFTLFETVWCACRSFEERRIEEDVVGGDAKWLKEGVDVTIQVWNGKIIGVEVPNVMELAVTETDPGVKGNTAQVCVCAC